MPEAKFIPGKTCIILDEIQDCPDASTSLKSFKLDNRFDIIATGSLLGVKGYGNKNTHIPELPLAGNRNDDVFKVYPTDIGILMAMLDPGTRADVLQGNLFGYKGAIFEGIMADFLHKKGQNLYYYQKDGGLELDFLIRHGGECVPCEVKAKTSKAKSIKTVLNHPEKYHISHVLKFGDYNVGRDGAILTVPSYMGFLLEFEGIEDIELPLLDINEVNRLAKEMLAE